MKEIAEERKKERRTKEYRDPSVCDAVGLVDGEEG